MRKLIAFIIVMMALSLTGCGSYAKQKDKEIVDKASDEVAYYDFISGGQQKVYSEDVFTADNPSIKKLSYKNSEGQITEEITYEYDEKNRYSKVETVIYNTKTYEIEEKITDEYSYDSYFSYRTSTSETKGCESYYEVKDTHDNIILVSVMNRGSAKNITYSYDYTYDTELRQEEYCYRGEGLIFSYYKVCTFNDNGDEISCIVQDSDDVYTIYQTEYEYDSVNRIVKRTETKTIEVSAYYTFLNEVTTYVSEYIYSPEGLLEKEVDTVISGQDIYQENQDITTIHYEYDSNGRLIQEKHDGQDIYFIVYEYFDETRD